MEPIFDLRNVSYTYLRRFEALRDVTASFYAGEQVAILGANGSGKSTLLAILNALNYPTSGEFYAFGTLIKEEVFDTLEDNAFNRFFRTKVGFLFQNPDIQLSLQRSLTRLLLVRSSSIYPLMKFRSELKMLSLCWG